VGVDSLSGRKADLHTANGRRNLKRPLWSEGKGGALLGQGGELIPAGEKRQREN